MPAGRNGSSPACSSTSIEMPDLSTLEIRDLQRLRKAVDARIAQLEKRRKEAAFKAVQSLAHEQGLTTAELAARFARYRVEHCYRHPSDPSRTWNGRGRKPQWIEEFLAAGGDLATLENIF